MQALKSWWLTIAAILLSAQAAVAQSTVVVVPAPLKPYVDALMDGVATSQSLLRPGQEPHDFALSPSQASMLANATILIVADFGINPHLKKMAAKHPKLKVIELSALEGAAPLPFPKHNPWLELKKAHTKEPDNKPSNPTAAPAAKKPDTSVPEPTDADESHDHDHSTTVTPVILLGSKEAKELMQGKPEGHTSKPPVNDPHLWLDPKRMAAIATPLANALAETYKDFRPALMQNATQLGRHLEQEVLPEIQAMLQKPIRTKNSLNLPEIPFITYHAAYQYYLNRFGLESYGEVTSRPEETMGAATTARIVDSAQKVRVRCLISEGKNSLVSRIAESSGARIIYLSPEQIPAKGGITPGWVMNDYDRLLYHITREFAGCL